MNKSSRFDFTTNLMALLATASVTAAGAEPAKTSNDIPAAETTSVSATTPSVTETESVKVSGKAAEEPDVTAPKKVTKVKEDLPNFHEVHPFLYRGGEPNEAGLDKLKGMGIGTIIDLRAPSEMKIDEKSYAKKLGMKYINLVMDSHAPTEQQVETMMHEIDKAKKASEKGEKNRALFLHCAHGSDRTGCMVGIYRVTHENWDYPTAYTEMRKYWFTPKFVRLSGAVNTYAENTKTAAAKTEK